MLFVAVHSSTGTSLIFSCRPLIPVIKFCINYSNYLHDADDSDRRSATLLAELISVRDGLSLSDISFSDGSTFACDDVCDLISHFALSYFFITLFVLSCTIYVLYNHS